MNKVEAGNIYTAAKQRSGETQRGAWELIAVTNERGKEEVTIFTRNIPSGVVEGQQFLVKEIHSATFRFRKDQNERWQPNISIEATVQPITSEFGEDSSSPWDSINATDGDLPWDDGYLPL